MAFTCGFFNSENGDRKYNAEQMSAIFDGIIADGVFTTIGDHMAVTAGTGMQVLVGSGKAWFDHTWNVNDAAYPLTIAASDVTLSRIDAIVLETNHSDSVRLNKLRVVQGTVASSPVKPTLTNSEKVHQHPLAWVTVAPGVTQIAASAIENAVGTSACPFVTGIIATTDIDDLFAQWNGEFDEWFDNLKAQLSDNVVANLQRQIDENKTQIQTNWDNTLKSYTKELLGLPDNSVPDDAFMALLVGTDAKAYRVKVQYPNGDPAVGFTVGGITALATTTLVTNNDGMVLGKSNSNSPTITVAKKYDDVKAASLVVTSTGTITDATITLAWDNTPFSILTSTNKVLNISNYCKKAAYILVGGGGGGGSTPSYGDDCSGGGGGGGGFYTNGEVSVNPTTTLHIIIGSGGHANIKTNSHVGAAGSSGGATMLTMSDSNNTNDVSVGSAGGGNGGQPGVEVTIGPWDANNTKRTIYAYGGSGGSGGKNGGSGSTLNLLEDRVNGNRIVSGSQTGSTGNSSADVSSIDPNFNDYSFSISGGGQGAGAFCYWNSTTINSKNGSPNSNYGGGGGGAGREDTTGTSGQSGIAIFKYLH